MPVVLEKEFTGEISEYGEPKSETVIGVRCGTLVVLTRDVTWIFLRRADFEAPWTCVNNCTGILARRESRNWTYSAKTGPPLNRH